MVEQEQHIGQLRWRRPPTVYEAFMEEQNIPVIRSIGVYNCRDVTLPHGNGWGGKGPSSSFGNPFHFTERYDEQQDYFKSASELTKSPLEQRFVNPNNLIPDAVNCDLPLDGATVTTPSVNGSCYKRHRAFTQPLQDQALALLNYRHFPALP